MAIEQYSQNFFFVVEPVNVDILKSAHHIIRALWFVTL